METSGLELYKQRSEEKSVVVGGDHTLARLKTMQQIF